MVWLVFLLLQTLVPGEPVVVTLTANEGPVEYSMIADEGTQLTVTARSLAAEPVDVTLAIWQNETLLAYNDDHLGDIDGFAPLDSAIVAFTPPTTGEYTLRIHSFSGAQSGNIEVLVEAVPHIPPCDTTPQSVPLSPHDPFTCWLELDEAVTLTASARDTSGTLDPVLRLFDADMTLLALNDDHGSHDLTRNVLDAKLVEKSAGAGRYYLQVSDFSGAAGTVELAIVRD